ncbi:hypothetical protein ACH9L7_09975 [Haloferax sp. S1W]|uniref:hypothetical protein n=1 Tax=Haloferax sp. S1W TaxID=3377110 RepID=UPI0037CAEDD8
MGEEVGVEFEFSSNDGSPWHPVHKGDDCNPHCDVSIRIGETWIPGENVYFEVAEVSFFNELLHVLIELQSGEKQVSYFIEHPSLFLFERNGDDQIQVTNYYNEESIEDPSKRLGIEKTGTCSLTGFENATLRRVQEIINRLRNKKLSKSDSNLFHVLEERYQQVK